MSEAASAADAFDAVADMFDTRFGAWLSVAAQRRAVRDELLHAFPRGSRLLELGGGTGEDAAFLESEGREVLLTDPAPNMIVRAGGKVAPERTRLLFAEDVGTLADERTADGLPPFDGAFSNFAGLNCVGDLAPVAAGLHRLIRPDGQIVLVLFGTLCPGEMLVEALRGRFRNVLRRCRRGEVPASLGGRGFTVRYHTAADVRRAMAPWFSLEARTAIGLFVPPSAAEPWISRHPRLLARLEALDARLARPLAPLGDHVLYRLRRRPGDGGTR